MDLVDLQNSSARIRNPFGFDFVWTWNKKKIKLVGDGQWKKVIGPLRDHMAKHLFNKVYNQYHDEHTAPLKAQGKFAEARAYRVPLEVENKIWFMITGEEKRKLKSEPSVEDANEAADLTNLKEEMSKNKGEGQMISVSKVIDEANMEALSNFNDGGVSTKTQGGTAKLVDEKPANDPLTEHLEAKKDAPKEPTPPANDKDPGFVGLPEA